MSKEVETEVEEAFGKSKPSCAIMYPFGNTTVAVLAYYAGRQHAREGNLFITPLLRQVMGGRHKHPHKNETHTKHPRTHIRTHPLTPYSSLVA